MCTKVVTPQTMHIRESIKGGMEQQNSGIRCNSGISRCALMAYISRHDHKVSVHRRQSQPLKDTSMKSIYNCVLQYRSFISSLLHACTRMAPRSIWRVKILGLPWKNFFPQDESWHLTWHFTTRVLAFPRHVSFPQDVDFHVMSHGIYTQRA